MNTSIDTIQPCPTMSLDIETTAIEEDIDNLDLSKTSQINLAVGNIEACNINYINVKYKSRASWCDSTAKRFNLFTKSVKSNFIKINFQQVKFSEWLNKIIYIITVFTTEVIILLMLRFVNRGFINRKYFQKPEAYKVESCFYLFNL
ncbi:hypothetical protein H6G06_05260 [Anabaena sphaerica FACHB-251]|uniref:Uncharacterized protein n=1 Tax=Anabaena sphaerica FACHB-251 TaxID=2692883 RepID=A0A926WFH9_9NOST|nr:hypothetical protein [Anabaena sphaerica]MBD2292904.1 hypothetical protein [Anabaena sphaerica FACHB-251]